jgi:hypothetical protein
MAQILPDIVVGDIGQCIYCDAHDDLRAEHIIPFGLAGQHVLLNASCKACADKTALIELKVLHESLGAFRSVLGLRTRRPKERPTELPARVRRAGGEWTEELLAMDKIVAVALFPKLPPPGIIEGRPPGDRFHTRGFVGIKVISKPDGESHPARRAGVEEIVTTVPMHPAYYMRMLAKIGLGYAVAQYGIAGIDPAVRGIVLLTDNHVDRWVGCPQPGTSLFDGPPDATYRVRVAEQEGGRVLAGIQLFGDHGGPEYLVVVGDRR